MAYDRVRFLATRDFLKFKKAFRWQEQSPTDLKNEQDQRFYFNLLQGMIRHQRLLEAEIKKRISQPFHRLEQAVIGILSLGIYQLLFMNKVPVRASIYESVELAIPFRIARKKALINAVLRSLQRDLDNQYTVEHFPLPIQTSHQDWMVAQWEQTYSPKEVHDICQANNVFTGVTIRPVQPWTREELAEALGKEAISIEFHPSAQHGLIVDQAAPLFKTTLFQQGAFFVQDASSQIFLDLAQKYWSGTVLDLCAAPGGKSIQIAQSPNLQNLVANDISNKRLGLFCQNIKRLQLKMPHLVVSDGRTLPFSNKFDTVVLDAPCSSSGTIQKNPHLKWIASRAELLSKTHLQSNLLKKSAFYVRPNGVLIYATCSLEVEENELQIHAFLEEHPHFKLIPFQCLQGMPENYNNYITSHGFYKSMPSAHMMGFFAAVLLHSS